jgi:ferredoxin
MTDDGVAKAKVEAVPEDQQGTCREAAEDCPVEAIQIEE